MAPPDFEVMAMARSRLVRETVDIIVAKEQACPDAGEPVDDAGVAFGIICDPSWRFTEGIDGETMP
ncbi:MAG: hypothetical protein R2787_17725 [Saprospiraceae bacterium]